jgi:RHS repeat-associated protein
LETRRDGDADAREQYVWEETYVDSPAARFLDANTDGDLVDIGDNTIFYLADVNSNISSVFDAASEQVAERYIYDSYGQDTIYDPTWSLTRSTSNVENSVGFGGYIKDSETANLYSRFRYMHPTLGRWISRDVAGYLAGTSLLEYASSSPTNYTDPSGLYGVDPGSAGHISLTEDAGRQVRGLNAGSLRRIVECNVDQDRGFNDAIRLALLSIGTAGLANLIPRFVDQYDVHFPGAGWPNPIYQRPVLEGYVNNASVSRRVDQAITHCDPCEMGRALHSLQDSYSHGGTDSDRFGTRVGNRRHPPNLMGHPQGRLLHGPREGQRSAGIFFGLLGSLFGLDPSDVDVAANDGPRYIAAFRDTRAQLARFRDNCPNCRDGDGPWGGAAIPPSERFPYPQAPR